jgi:hypothetical protein
MALRQAEHSFPQDVALDLALPADIVHWRAATSQLTMPGTSGTGSVPLLSRRGHAEQLAAASAIRTPSGVSARKGVPGGTPRFAA